ncbi:MAG: lipopolysaccharide transport periplasmic protein LptA [Deltaproteobacteria bacterium]|nr:lipopolysaccharide transport periplasmic protein LptA [Deltaproteobacteria bacterium]
MLFLIHTVLPVSAKPIHIEADHMTSTEKTDSVLFEGDVDAKQGDVRIRADKMTVFYSKKQAKTKKKKAGKSSQQVEKLVCIGNVEVTKGEWLGTGKKMIYLAKDQQIILLDNAKAWQGQNMVAGNKIIYYIGQGRSEVIGGKTSATVADKGKKGKKKSRVNMTIMQK